MHWWFPRHCVRSLPYNTDANIATARTTNPKAKPRNATIAAVLCHGQRRDASRSRKLEAEIPLAAIYLVLAAPAPMKPSLE